MPPKTVPTKSAGTAGTLRAINTITPTGTRNSHQPKLNFSAITPCISVTETTVSLMSMVNPAIKKTINAMMIEGPVVHTM